MWSLLPVGQKLWFVIFHFESHAMVLTRITETMPLLLLIVFHFYLELKKISNYVNLLRALLSTYHVTKQLNKS